MARALPANNLITLRHYYRSADLLSSQAQLYQVVNNQEQEYVMRMRLANLITVTIPQHPEFSRDSRYARYKQLIYDQHLPHLERLRKSLEFKTLEGPPLAVKPRRPPEAVQIVASNLPEVDWGSAVVAAPPLQLPAPTPAGTVGGDAAATYTPSYTPSSAQALQRHALFAPKAALGSRSGNSSGSSALPLGPRYPEVTPGAAAIDLLWQRPASSGDSAGAAAAQPAGAPPDLSLLESYQPSPSAGPGLGPQEVEVGLVDPSTAAPGGSCAQPGGVGGGEGGGVLALVEPGGVKPLAKRGDLRDVHISVALMNDFLHFASNNTRRGIESCGILAGSLSACDGVFSVSHLIIPKQEGTTDTVAALNEEDIYEAQASRELYPLGWIHTHPTQTCFLSSVDVHTHCGYQTMLDEAVAIVMAPTDSRNRCGIFRLSTPGGLSLVQRCPHRGFHAHPRTETGQELYELCGHVYLNPRTKHEVLDLR